MWYFHIQCFTIGPLNLTKKLRLCYPDFWCVKLVKYLWYLFTVKILLNTRISSCNVQSWLSILVLYIFQCVLHVYENIYMYSISLLLINCFIFNIILIFVSFTDWWVLHQSLRKNPVFFKCNFVYVIYMYIKINNILMTLPPPLRFLNHQSDQDVTN